MIVNILSLIIGGAVGTISRYLLTAGVHTFLRKDFIYGTMTVNLIGCLIIGLMAGLTDRFNIDRNIELLVVAGFCGAFTTFSTFMLETSEMIREGNNLLAFTNIAISIVAGFFLLRLGIFIGEAI